MAFQAKGYKAGKQQKLRRIEQARDIAANPRKILGKWRTQYLEERKAECANDAMAKVLRASDRKKARQVRYNLAELASHYMAGQVSLALAQDIKGEVAQMLRPLVGFTVIGTDGEPEVSYPAKFAPVDIFVNRSDLERGYLVPIWGEIA